MNYLYQVRVAPGIQYDCTGDAALRLRCGDEVVIRWDRYQDLGVVVGCCDSEAVDEQALIQRQNQQTRGRRVQGQRPPVVNRLPTLMDRGKSQEVAAWEAALQRTAQEKIAAHRLPMKLVNCHSTLDRGLVVFQFTAEGRVDFRELVRDLAHALRTRVELRQIGIRDEASIQGGIGCCGRPFCCTTFLHEFVSINVKMAKEQGLSLNPSNISGACGRLKCCLRYEAEGYRDLRKALPRNGSACETPSGPGRVLDANALTQRVRVRLEGEGDRVVDFAAAEISFRSNRPAVEPEPEPQEPTEETSENLSEAVSSEAETGSGNGGKAGGR